MAGFTSQMDRISLICSMLKLDRPMARTLPLRLHIQSGNIVIPGSKNPAHIKDNFALFDFALTEEEMAEIAIGAEHMNLPRQGAPSPDPQTGKNVA